MSQTSFLQGTKKVQTRYIPTRCQQVTNKAYLGDKIGKSDNVDKHVAAAIETVTDLRSRLYTFKLFSLTSDTLR